MNSVISLISAKQSSLYDADSKAEDYLETRGRCYARVVGEF